MITENSLKLESFDLGELSQKEAMTLEGGSIWGDAAYLLGATLKCIWVFAKTAGEYQASLPPTLKK
jgi:hypothetical protein